MSIFTRLFNKGSESEGKEPTEEGSAAEPRGNERGRKAQPSDPNAAPAEARPTTMRPLAPSFQINPPASEQEGAITASPVMAVGAPDSKGGGQRAVIRAPSASGGKGQGAPPVPAEKPPAKPRPGGPPTTTARMGTGGAGANALPAPTGVGKPAADAMRSTGPGTPPAVPRATGSQATTSATAPRGGAAAAPPPRGGGVRAKATVDARGFVGHADSVAHSRPPAEPEAAPLTLELGASLDGAPASSPAIPVGPVAPAGAAETSGSQRPVLRAGVADFESVGTLLNDLDAAFGAIVESANGQLKRLRPSESPPPNTSISELQELFVALAANHMRQVRDFMIGVKWGDAPREWVPICEPAVNSLMRAAKEMDLPLLSTALEGYRGALAKVAGGTGVIADDDRELLLAAYGELSKQMPGAFGLDDERGRREAIIVHALLQQVPEVRKVTLDKMYAAGLTSLDILFLAKADEIAATTGISEALAQQIVEKIQRYRREIAALADATRTAERTRLGELVTEMRKLHESFEQVSSGWTDDAHAEKKRLRQARSDVFLKIKVLLARLGEVDRLGHLERMPFERKLVEIENYLRDIKADQASAS